MNKPSIFIVHTFLYLFMLLYCPLLGNSPLYAQSDCNIEEYEKAFCAAEDLMNEKQFKEALHKFNTARALCEQKGKAVDAKIEELFEAINREKERAEVNEVRAKEALAEAERQKRIAENNERKTNEALEETEKQKKRAEENESKAKKALEETEKQKKRAEENENRAKKALEETKKQRKRAEENENRAKKALEETKKQRKRAEENESKAKEALEETKKQKKIADKERQKAEKQKKIVELEKAKTDSVLAVVKAEQAKNKKIIDKLYFYEGRLTLAYKDGKFGFIDKEGNVVVDYQFQTVEQFDSKGYAKVKIKNIDYLVDTLGKVYKVAYKIEDLDNDITALDLRYTKLRFFPDRILEYKQLEVLFLQGHNSHNESNIKVSLKGIGKLKKIKKMHLTSMNLIELPDEIGNLANLQELNLELGVR